MTNTDKSSTHQHTVRGTPTTNTGVHSHGLTAADARIAALEAQMADVILRITKVEASQPPPVPPPIEPTPGTGVHRYISPTGSDSADGSITYPWRTISRFFPVAKKGDTLEIRGGTYSNHPSCVAGHGLAGLLGTATEWITIRAYPGETPVFSGGSGPLIHIAGQTSPSAYVVIDGIEIENRSIGDSGAFYTGYWGSAFNVEHITFRNLAFSHKYGDSLNKSHGVYIASASRYVTVEDSAFNGPAGGGCGSGVTTGSWSTTPAPTDIVLQGCSFEGFTQGGIIVWHEVEADHDTMDVTIDDCTFVDNTNIGDMRIEKHGPTSVTNCSTTNSYTDPAVGTGAPWIFHAYHSIADVTQSGNVFDQ